MKRALIGVVLLSCVATVVPAQRQATGATVVASPAAPLVIGETFTITSATLGEVRRINVYAPPRYAESPDVRLPVLYMPDGGMAEDFLHVAGLVQVSAGNGTMRPFLLVGIENTERRRDMTGPDFARRGQADRAARRRLGGVPRVHPHRADATGDGALSDDGGDGGRRGVARTRGPAASS